jgi:hypothetical protein
VNVFQNSKIPKMNLLA